MAEYRNPIPTVDIIIELTDEKGRPGIVLIKRKNEPKGWALPGGFVDYGESLEKAAIREAKEETSLDIALKRQFHAYSEPGRDPRRHTITTVFVAAASGRPKAADDAADIRIFFPDNIDVPLAFDHAEIINDYVKNKY
jgi:8-oxo-dGTP diphosphatase